jgi:hypothetical protein
MREGSQSLSANAIKALKKNVALSDHRELGIAWSTHKTGDMESHARTLWQMADFAQELRALQSSKADVE